ncbi:MAG TPA: hypothetical protein PKM65_17025 [Spirochaetota bacterium]|nr:hypothetical protein [Spirochaetota bacterium]HNT12170.1 hypothetical protein [Spirochaetota bacterium]
MAELVNAVPGHEVVLLFKRIMRLFSSTVFGKSRGISFVEVNRKLFCVLLILLERIISCEAKFNGCSGEIRNDCGLCSCTPSGRSDYFWLMCGTIGTQVLCVIGNYFC